MNFLCKVIFVQSVDVFMIVFETFRCHFYSSIFCVELASMFLKQVHITWLTYMNISQKKKKQANNFNKACRVFGRIILQK